MQDTPIQLVIFDWAGTTIDFGSCAPAMAFRKVFAAHGIEATDAQAREPMGFNKREHLVAMLRMEQIAEQWQLKHGRPWDDGDVDQLYADFAPLQLQAIKETSNLVPGLIETIETLRSQNIRIGGTTGYFQAAAEAVEKSANNAGFKLDANACADDVPAGRPAPWMIFRIMEQLQVYPAHRVVKIGDTIADIKAGLAAGCWSVGVCDSSSITGLSRDEFARLSDQERAERVECTAERFREAGCHAIIQTITETPRLIEQIQSMDGSSPRVL